MPRRPALYQCNRVVAKGLPHLSKPGAACLALGGLGMTLARPCSLTAIALAGVPLLKLKSFTPRERLRDPCREAPAKAGTRRRTLDLSTCRAPGLARVIKGRHSRQLAPAVDAAAPGERFVVLAVSVRYRGSAAPAAWKALRAGQPGPWQPEWEALLRQFRGVAPDGWKVLVLADRGPYARWPFEAITASGWRPLLRTNAQGKFRPKGRHRWLNPRGLVQRAGPRRHGRGAAFENEPGQPDGTLPGCWEEGHDEPRLAATGLPPAAAGVCRYGLRAWIEQGFKQLKGGGWQWQHTRLTDPARAERLWLALALATWWLPAAGGAANAGVPAGAMAAVPQAEHSRRPRWRLVAAFRLGWALILAALIKHERMPLGHGGGPDPWPTMLQPETPPGRQKTLHL